MSLLKKASDKGYRCNIIHRNSNNLIFIQDISGNLFEMNNSKSGYKLFPIKSGILKTAIE